jgi:steroid delta-isomerase-like uncharacterized protein
MTPQQNIQLARRWFEEIWDQRRFETIYELSLPESISHMEHGEVSSRGDFQAFQSRFLKAFPDLRVTIEDTIAEGENVVVRWFFSATHGGDALGCRATGKTVKMRGMTWLRFRDGKLVESWYCWNLGALMQYLTNEASSDGSCCR